MCAGEKQKPSMTQTEKNLCERENETISRDFPSLPPLIALLPVTVIETAL